MPELQNCQENLDAGYLASAILIDLSKAYDTLPPWNSIITKLQAYGFSIESLQLI